MAELLTLLRRKPRFSPTQVPGLQLWLRSDRGLYQNSAFSSPASSSGDPVGGWQDQSGNGRHLLQTTAAKRPTLQTGVLNNAPVVRWDGVDDYLAAAFTQAQPFHLFMVGRVRAARAQQYFTDGGSPISVYFYTGTATPRFDMGAPTTGCYVNASTAWHVLSLFYGGTGSHMRFNGAEVARGNCGANGFTELTLGSRGDRIYGFADLDLAELLLYQGEQSGVRLQQIERYLNGYGVY